MTVTTFLEYNVQIGVVTAPDFPAEDPLADLPADAKARRTLVDRWKHSAQVILSPSFDSRLAYAIREQLEDGLGKPASEGLFGDWQGDGFESSVAFMDRDELLAFFHVVVRERVPHVKPTAYLASFNSDDVEFLTGMNEPISQEYQAELASAMEEFLAGVRELREGQRYALLVEQV